MKTPQAAVFGGLGKYDAGPQGGGSILVFRAGRHGLFCRGANAQALAYYRTRRDLEDIFEFCQSLVNGEYSEEERRTVYGHMERILGHLRNVQV